MKSIWTALAELGDEAKRRRKNFLAQRNRLKNDRGPAYLVNCEGGPFNGKQIAMRGFETLDFVLY